MKSFGDSKDIKSQDGRSSSSKSVSSVVSASNQKCNKPERLNKSFHYVRFFIIILGGMACGSMFLTRLSVTVAMISMVNHTHLYLLEHPNETTIDEPLDEDKSGEFKWTNEIQQSIISGYMIAYTIPQPFTTRLTLKYGIRNSIPISLSLCALSCLLTPILAYWGWQWMLALRLINGLGASAILPSMIGAIEKWVPYKNSAGSLSLLQFVQTILYASTPLISGLLASIHWKWAFYVPAVVAGTFAIIWYTLARDDPDSCPFISQQEIDLIKGLDEFEDSNKTNNNKQTSTERKRPPRTDLPWYFMFKIKSFYFFVVIWMLYCSTFGGFLFLMPSYFNRVLKLSVADNGFYNFIIQVGVLFSMLWPNPVINYLRNHFNFSLTSARRVVVFGYTLMSIITWCYVAAFHDNQIIVICINRFFNMTNDTIITATLMSQFGRDGLSSVVYSMMNTFGNLASVLFCWSVGRFLDKTGESLACWSWVFIAMSILNVILFLLYAVFVKSEPVEISPAKKTEEKDGAKIKGIAE